MDRAHYVNKRRGKYLAQTLEHFETHIEPLLAGAPGGAAAVQDFKGLVRARFQALATDAVEIMSLDGINGVAIEMRDALSPTGRP